MFSVYFGTETVAVRNAAHTVASKAEAAGAVLTTIDTDTYTEGVLTDAVGSNSLFGEELFFVLDTPSQDVLFKEAVEASLEALATSPHTFLIIEGALLADAKKQFQKYATELTEFKAETAERFNVFALADSLAKKDKKTLWMQLMEAQKAGLAAEEIIGTLWWQLKSLRLAAVTKTALEAGMKDYPYQKAKRSLGIFKEGELTALSHALLMVYHDGHGGLRDIDAALEAWVLTM